MKRTMLALVTVTTIAAAGISIRVALLLNPTEAQTNLANAANTIAIAGTTALFGLLDDEDKDDRDKTQDKHKDS